MRTRSIALLFLLPFAAAAVVALADEPRAHASFIDAGIEAGVQKRNLADTSYKVGFAWQLHAELALLPPILMFGPYVTFNTGVPDTAHTTSDPSSVRFTAIGARVKLKIPIPGDFKPYGVAGIGWVHGDFPDQTLKYCDPQIPTACVSTTVPNATANFAEFILGGGLLWEVASPFALTAEFNWRPTTGYKNDTYQNQLNNADSGKTNTNPPEPSRNGSSWTAMLGIALVI
jgi:opacity protein-like surface antigen